MVDIERTSGCSFVRSFVARMKATRRPSVSVLVVDDEQSVRKFVERVLGEAGYTTTSAADGPEAIDVVRIKPPESPLAGAGESSIRLVAAGITNDVFDATGVRLRRAPLTPERLKPALA